ncbi:Hypothetical Protein FCC1311_042412 [Hondaea fermentalgiana]|uniref:Uncharacterized protein n=1 Tax=Hondaea fermentalgiana TaxID=2315210 RepID=A0A2R5GE60_9STRA|nr:Hypothetical Protein FCC1311_042412 [Hondaea fermentalgiana]|eukprot:GBG28018.1 Hypothetical Protein FCC1311_042412 [Hondaea fermentalgiana]
MQANSRARSNNPTPGRLRWPKNHAGPETVREIPPRPRKDAQSREEQHCDTATGRELAKLRVQLRCLQHEFELEILRRQEARAAQRESEEAHALEVESLRLAVQQAETRARHARVLAEIRERETLKLHTGNLLEDFVCSKREVRVLREALAHAEESKLRAEDRATAAEKRARRAERRSSRISAESDFVKQEARAVFAALRQRDAHLSDLVDFTLQDL